MNILAIDTATNVASTAILSNNKLLCESIVDDKLNHSLNLLPTLETMIKNTDLTFRDFDYFAVTIGPGSFTGLRIGLSTAKGLAQATGKSIIPISTLEALAYNITYTEGVICPILDARRKRFYAALFSSNSQGKITRLTQDLDLRVGELEDKLRDINETVFILGDGESAFLQQIPKKDNIIPIAPFLATNKASSLAYCASINLDKQMDYHLLEPTYLRSSYAERKK